MEVVQYPQNQPDSLARKTRGSGIRALRRTELWKVLRHCGVKFDERKDNWDKLIERAEDADITVDMAAEALRPKPAPVQQLGEKAHASIDIETAPRGTLRGLCKEAGWTTPNTVTIDACREYLRGLHAS